VYGTLKTWVCGHSPGFQSHREHGCLSCECCVLSDRGLCDELITHPEEPTDCGASLCDLETSWMGWPCPTGGLLRKNQINKQTVEGNTVDDVKRSSWSFPHPHISLVCVNNHKALIASSCYHYNIPVKRMVGWPYRSRGSCAGGGNVILSMRLWRVFNHGTSWHRRSIIWRSIRVIKSRVLRSVRHFGRERETRLISKYLTRKHFRTGHLKDRWRVRQELNAVIHLKDVVNIRLCMAESNTTVFLFSSYML
jgi:hypothetical protein